jgi:hypothetical protein
MDNIYVNEINKLFNFKIMRDSAEYFTIQINK